MDMKKIYVFLLAIIAGSFINAQNSIHYTDITPGFTGVHYTAGIWLDVDNNGLMDVFYFGSDTSNAYYTRLYLNNGDDSFTEFTGTDINIPKLAIGSVDTADFNGDGLTDLLIEGALQNSDGFADIFLNNGDTTFTRMNLNLYPYYMGSVAACDYDGDGDMDFAISGYETANGGYHCQIYRNDGGTFTDVGLSLPEVMYGVLRWADYNGDGKPDLLITGWDNVSVNFYTKIWKNLGNDQFSETQIDLYQSWIGDAAWGDFDNDGDLDLFLTGVGGSGSHRMAIQYTNTGDSLIVKDSSFVGVSHSSVEIADFDNDGDMDIFYSGLYGDGMGSGEYLAKLLLNDGQGNYSDSATIDFPGIYWGDCRAADYNNDSIIDVFYNGMLFKSGTDIDYATIYKGTKSEPSKIRIYSHNLKVFPNPADNFIYVSYEKKIRSYIINNVSGQTLLENQVDNNNFRINISSFPQGLYILKVVGDDFEKETVFIKK